MVRSKPLRETDGKLAGNWREGGGGSIFLFFGTGENQFPDLFSITHNDKEIKDVIVDRIVQNRNLTLDSPSES